MGAATDKENASTPKKHQPLPRTGSPLTPIHPNTLNFNSMQSRASVISHGIDTQDLKITLSGQSCTKGNDPDSISSFGTTSQALPPRTATDEDVVMSSQPSSQQTIRQTQSNTDIIMDTATPPASLGTLLAAGVSQTISETPIGTETQLDELDTQLETQTQIQFETRMTERDDDAVCVCQSRVCPKPFFYFRFCR